MPFFNKKSSGGFKTSFKPGFKPNDGKFKGDRKFSATCSNCQMICEVPFKPNGSKPVFCNNCFRTDGGATRSSEKPVYRSTPQIGNSDIEKQLLAIHIKLDLILAAISKV